MRALAIFLLGVALVFGAIAAAIILTTPTERAFVVVDNACPMREVWNQVPGTLDDIEDEGYAEYARATEKDLVHSWQDSLELQARRPYAPCELGEIETYAEAATADASILITTAASCPVDSLTAWEVILLEP